MKSDWKKREEAAKRAKRIKHAMLRDVNARVETLWGAANADGSGFSAAERKAIADASYSIRSLIGGWINRR